MEKLLEKTVGEIVADDYRTASIFQAHQIDFCCNGNIELELACNKNNLDANLIVEELKQVTSEASKGIDYATWPVDLLVDYIEKKHHRYVEEKVLEIGKYLEKICQVHGQAHSELIEIANLFEAGTGELTKHMKKEELILFPFIRKMVKASTNGDHVNVPFFGSVQSPIATMHEEHDNEGERFRKISALSNQYTPPKDACNTYQVTYAMLKEFEEDLHLHIHLENNILFPKAVALEAELKELN